MGFECTFLQPPKKRGPAGRYVCFACCASTDLMRISRVSQIKRRQVRPRHVPDQTGGNTPSPQTGQTSVENQFPTPVLAPSIAGWPGDHQANIQHQYAGNYHSTLPDPVSQVPTQANWADDTEYWLPDTIDPQQPAFGFPDSNIYVQSALPPIVPVHYDHSELNVQPAESDTFTQHSSPAQPVDDTTNIWPSYISEASLIPWIDVYFDRLHPTLPVLNRSALLTRLFNHEYCHNHTFAAMLLSLCAFALTQPIEIAERQTTSTRATQARLMMTEAVKLRNSSDFGENPTIEAILTSFFLFGCLFGSNQHNAARLRLREAVELALVMGLNDPTSYPELSSEEKGQQLRTYLVLSITERYIPSLVYAQSLTTAEHTHCSVAFPSA